jgi:amidase
MGFVEYSNYDGLGLAELVKKKKVKPAELVEAAIERIERHNPQLNAVVFKAYDEARLKATTKLSGAFAGVPMLLKDILGDKKGWPTRRASGLIAEIGMETTNLVRKSSDWALEQVADPMLQDLVGG